MTRVFLFIKNYLTEDVQTQLDKYADTGVDGPDSAHAAPHVVLDQEKRHADAMEHS